MFDLKLAQRRATQKKEESLIFAENLLIAEDLSSRIKSYHDPLDKRYQSFANEKEGYE